MVATKLYTADDLLAMGSAGEDFELLDGELSRVSPTSSESAIIASYLYGTLLAFVRPRRLGLLVTAEGGWVIRRDPDTMLAPDIAFIARERAPVPLPRDKFFPLPPDLAVEVVSPSDPRAKVVRKVAQYIAAGVPLIWVVSPTGRSVTVHRLGEPPVMLGEGETLDGGDVIPGFAIPVAEIFADPLA